MRPTHLLLALALCLWLCPARAFAALVYSGSQNISVPNTFDGVFITFTNVNNAASFTTSFTEPGTWHFNPFFGGSSVSTSDLLRPVTTTGATNAPIVNLAYGTVIDGTDPDLFPTGFSGSTTHMGTGAGQFQSGVMGIMGFALQFTDLGPTHYGYARVTFYNDGSSGTIHDWAWDTTAGASITAVPEPSQVVTLALGMGLVAFAGWRRRTMAKLSGDEETGDDSRP